MYRWMVTTAFCMVGRCRERSLRTDAMSDLRVARRFSFASPASRCLCGGIAASRAVSWPSDLREITAWWSSGDGSSGAERDAASACEAR